MKASCGQFDVIVQTRKAASGFLEDENISMLSQSVFHFVKKKLWSVQLKDVLLKHIRVITKLPNTEQSSKGKGKTHKSLTWYRHFQRNGRLNQILRCQTSRFHYGWKVPVVTITTFLTILGQNRYNSSQRSTLWKSIVYYRLCRTV